MMHNIVINKTWNSKCTVLPIASYVWMTKVQHSNWKYNVSYVRHWIFTGFNHSSIKLSRKICEYTKSKK